MIKWDNEFEKRKFYKSKTWLQLRDKIRKRDGGICQKCGKLVSINSTSKYTVNGVVDHIKSINETSSDYDKFCEDNLRLLCIACHNNKHMADDTSLNKEYNALNKLNLGDINGIF